MPIAERHWVQEMACFSRNMGQATASLCRRVNTSTFKSQGQVRVADETQFWETWESRGMGQKLIFGAQVREGNSSRKNRISQNAVQNRRKDILDAVLARNRNKNVKHGWDCGLCFLHPFTGPWVDGKTMVLSYLRASDQGNWGTFLAYGSLLSSNLRGEECDCFRRDLE